MSALAGGGGASWRSCSRVSEKNGTGGLLQPTVRASHSIDDKNRVYKQLGMFSLKKKIEDAILRAEMLAPMALEIEEEKRIKQEKLVRDCDLWDDPVKSNEILVKLADCVRAVDSLKDLKYKAEEAKLITELAEMEGIEYGLFEQAYDASLDVSKYLHQYEMSKLLKEPFDIEGACIIIKASSQDTNSEIWAEQLLGMYVRWAEKQGYEARIVDKDASNAGISTAIVEFEFEYAYGNILGEQGVHRLIGMPQNGSAHDEGSSAAVDVIPLFLRTAPDFPLNEEDLIVSYLSRENRMAVKQIVSVQHIPTGVTIESSGERSRFANKMKAINRLKAKLLVISKEQGLLDVHSIVKDGISQPWRKETRRYVSYPQNLVHDVQTGLQVPDLNLVLAGNIEPFIGAHIHTRRSNHHAN